MSPFDPITREELHVRQIDMRGYRRSDGLFEISASLSDRKTHDFTPPSDGRFVPAHSPIHELGLTLILDADLVIRGVNTFIQSHPYRQCPGGGDVLQALIGLRIGSGWQTEVRKRLPSGETCTHLRELLLPMASTAMQTTNSVRAQANLEAQDAEGRPVKINSCYAYGASRELVMKRWPQWVRGTSPASSDPTEPTRS